MCNLQGTTPPVQVALDLYNILSESDTDLRQPVRLETQLLQDQRMDSDVGQSMLQLLQVTPILLTPTLPLLRKLFTETATWQAVRGYRDPIPHMSLTKIPSDSRLESRHRLRRCY